MGRVGYFADQQQVFSSEARAVSPVVTVFVQATDGHVVTHALVGRVFPDRCTDTAHADFLNGSLLFIGHVGCLLFFIDKTDYLKLLRIRYRNRSTREDSAIL